MMMARGVAGFAAGAALSVIAVRSVSEWAYAVPPLIAAGAFVIGTREPATD